MATPTYLDNAATTRVRDEALAAMLPLLKGRYGNPSSAHGLGVEAARLLQEARRRCAEALGIAPSALIFTSGGTEANNLALRGAARAMARRGRHIVCSAVEHPAVLETARALSKQDGFRLTELTPDRCGRIRVEEVVAALEDDTILVSVMEVQNEVGAVNPVAAIARAVKAERPEALVHCDGVQAAGKRPLPADVDLYALSGHKLHGPKGIGALVARARIVAQLTGGGQEGGLRSGTENLPGIAGLAVALSLAVAERDESVARWRELNQTLRAGLEGLGGHINGPGLDEGAAPNIVSVAFPGLPAEVLLHSLEARSVYVSNGSACASKKRGGSHVLRAMGLAEDRRASTLRFSFGADTRAADIVAALAALEQALTELAPLRRPAKRPRGRRKKRVT